jgi:hypothetical protein
MDQSEELVGPTMLPKGAKNSGITSVKETPQGTIRTRLYRDGHLLAENFPVDEISEQLKERHGCAIWLDLCGPNSEHLKEAGWELETAAER